MIIILKYSLLETSPTFEKSGIYKIDFPNGKSYIGLSNNIRKRMLAHNCAMKTYDYPLYRALRKYGEINEFYILEEIPGDNRELLGEREKYWIEYYNTTDSKFGYNISEGGDGVPNQKGCDSPKAKLNEEQLYKIIYELKNCPYKTFAEIGKPFNVGADIVCNINYGYNYIQENINYPIRNHLKGWNLASSNLRLDDIFEIKDMLKNTNKSQKYIADLFNVQPNVINSINLGKTFKEENESYPIRDEKHSKEAQFSDFIDVSKVNNIINDLENTKLSMIEIGKKYNVSRIMISKINRGVAFCSPNNLQYPIRNEDVSRKMGGYYNKKINEETLNNIIKDLKEDKLSIKNIAEKYNVSRDTISDINNGHSYVNKKLTYPIRKLKYISNRTLLPEQVKEVYNLLKNTNLTIKEISKKFSISDSAISDINKGITYFNDEISYPIRSFDASTHNRKLTDEQVDEIIDKLKNTKISQREIGRMFNITHNTIGKINKGEFYHRDDQTYPIRKTKKKNKEES